MSPGMQQGVTWTLSRTQGESRPKEWLLLCQRGHLPWYLQCRECWLALQQEGSRQCHYSSTHTSPYSTIQVHTSSPAKKATLPPGFHKETSLNGISKDSLVILWDGMTITNSKFLRVKKRKLKTDQQYNLLQCVSIFFPREIMWALSVQWYSGTV